MNVPRSDDIVERVFVASDSRRRVGSKLVAGFLVDQDFVALCRSHEMLHARLYALVGMRSFVYLKACFIKGKLVPTVCGSCVAVGQYSIPRSMVAVILQSTFEMLYSFKLGISAFYHSMRNLTYQWIHITEWETHDLIDARRMALEDTINMMVAIYNQFFPGTSKRCSIRTSVFKIKEK